ncbi:MAG: DUF1579 family protein [Fimbriimonadaceae bacterium]
MKKVLITLAVIASCWSMGQEMDVTPPKEMKNLSFLVGNFRGSETYDFGGGPQKGASTIRSAIGVGGRWLVGTHSSKSKTMNLEGHHMLSYDKDMKKYRAWWFDNAGSYAMEMNGNFKGKTLVMTSLPTPVPGMAEPMVMRASWTPVGSRGLKFVLETQQGGQWMKIMEGSYRK